jgi:hypothetical protein
MSKLSIDQRNVMNLFQDKRSDFLIPDYQRPYAWDESKCNTLWEDLFTFAFPNENFDNFNDEEEYFLGPIVTYLNKENNKLEVIDGQQRLTTLMLLLRAFYDKFLYAQDSNTVETRKEIAKCIWKTDLYGNPKMDELKIQSEVAGEEDKEEFLNILKTGIVPKNYKSKYAINFKFFKEKIDDFALRYSMFVSIFPQIIMRNCILLPIEADKQETALRIFSTLNDRGMPLSDADIFKAQLYKYYTDKGNKQEFIDKWKELEQQCSKLFKDLSGSPMDELFTKYMYYERAKLGISSSTTEALRKFYEKDNYSLLKNENTFKNLQLLADFWEDVSTQNQHVFSDDVLKDLFILNYAPNGMWSYFLSVYFMQNKDMKNELDNEKLHIFLGKVIGFVWAYAFTNPGVNALRTPIYAEMINIVNGKEVTFNEFKFDEEQVRNIISNYSFINQRPITKSMLTLYAFSNPKQNLISLNEEFQIEHIYAVSRNIKEHGLNDDKLIEKLGNKSLLEKDINIKASDYRFEDKKPYYYGTIQRRSKKEARKTNIIDLLDIADNNIDFTEKNIINRNKEIEDKFISYLRSQNLIKD